MKERMIIMGLCLILVFFLFEGCNLPTDTDNDNNGEVCESQRYDVEFLYKRTKPPLQKDNGPLAEATISLSWDYGLTRRFEKIGPDKYRVLIKDFPINRPKGLANYKYDIAVIVRDYLLADWQAEYPFRATVVTEDVFARVIGKTGYVKLTRNQPASICSGDSEIKEILIDLYCDGRIN